MPKKYARNITMNNSGNAGEEVTKVHSHRSGRQTWSTRELSRKQALFSQVGSGECLPDERHHLQYMRRRHGSATPQCSTTCVNVVVTVGRQGSGGERRAQAGEVRSGCENGYNLTKCEDRVIQRSMPYTHHNIPPLRIISRCYEDTTDMTSNSIMHSIRYH